MTATAPAVPTVRLGNSDLWSHVDKALDKEVERFARGREHPLLATKVICQISQDLLPMADGPDLKRQVIESLEYHLKVRGIKVCDEIDPIFIQIVPTTQEHHCVVSWIWNLPVAEDKLRMFRGFLSQETERLDKSLRESKGMVRVLDDFLHLPERT